MNFVDNRTIAICICCGAELLPDCDGDDPTGAACDSCFAESEAKAATARQFERDDEFRWLSLEWLRSPAAAALRKAESLLQWDRFEERNRALPAADEQRD